MNKRYLLAGLLMGLTLSSHAQSSAPENQPEKILAADGSPRFVIFREGGKHYDAKEATKALREQLQLSQDEQVIRVKVETDDLGFTHEKYQQYYRGVKVEHALYSVHARGGVVESLSGSIRHPSQLDISPKLTAPAALERALAFVGAKEYMWQIPREEEGLKQRESNSAATYKPQGELVIVRDVSSQESNKASLVLAWKFDIYAHEPLSRAYLYIDAQTGKVVLQDAIMKDIAASFATKYSSTRTVETDANPGGGFRLRDMTRGSGILTLTCRKGVSLTGAVDFIDNDNNWTAAEYNNANFDNAAGDAHFGAEATFDYWRSVHGRNSWDGAGGQLRSYVHYAKDWNNARWDGDQMLYGDGGTSLRATTSLDFCAHEIGHGVCQATAGLIYDGESGALNEGFSDIWGACVEQNATAALGLTKSTWLIGEELALSGPALRSMSDPKSLGQPAYYKGQNWYSGSDDFGGVHTNSGVLAHWFYILSQGKSGTNEGNNYYSVNGIGINSAARIAYQTERFHLSADSRYADARTATILAATEIFGTCTPEVIAVTNAWFAVGIGPRAPIVFISSGPTQICGGETATYTANVANVTWSATPTDLFTTTSGSGSQFSTSTAAGAQGTGTITMTSCGQTDTRTVKIGGPEPSGYFYVSSNGDQTLRTYQYVAVGSGGSDIGMFITNTPYTFRFTSDLAGLYLTNTVGTSTHFILKPGQGTTITATSTNAPCTMIGRYAFIAQSSSGYRLAFAPNPVSSDLTVTAVDTGAADNAPASSAAPPFDADLYDSYGKKVKSQHSDHGKAVLDVRELPEGLYNLRSGTGKDAMSEHIQVTH